MPVEPREPIEFFEPLEASEPLIDLSDEIAALAAEPDEPSAVVEEFAGEPVGVYTMPSLDEEPVVEELLAEPLVVEPREPQEPLEPLPDAVCAPMMLSMERLWPPLEGVPIEIVSAERPAAAAPKPTPKKRKPVQDEWGFFDPEQCGFPALLAKLDEITGDSAEDRTEN